MKVSLMGFEHVVSCLCECEVKARQELDEDAAGRRTAAWLYQRKIRRTSGRRFWEWKFENDNGKQPEDTNRQAVCRKLDRYEEKNVGLLLMGPVGTGKSFLQAVLQMHFWNRENVS